VRSTISAGTLTPGTLTPGTLTPGTHLFVCAIYPWMEETVVVR
jgi:hypothetical protein